MVWLLSLVAVICWGAWTVAEKMATRHLPPMAVQVWCLIGYGFLAPVVAGLGRTTGTKMWWSAPGVAWSLASAAISTVACTAFFFAIQNAKVSVVTSITSVYPAMTVLFAWALLGEVPTWRTLVGIATIILGVTLLQP